MASSINLDQLTAEIRAMSVRSKLYKVLKQELTQRGYWKNRKRGDGGKYLRKG